jgi:hypothetical protein
MSFPVDPKGYNWKEAGKLLGPYVYWTIGGPDAAPSSIQDIIRIWQGWMGYLSLLGIDQEFSAPCLCPMSLPLVSAPCLCPLSLPPVSAPGLCTCLCTPLLGEIVCITNEICLWLGRAGHFTSVDMSGNLSEPSSAILKNYNKWKAVKILTFLILKTPTENATTTGCLN